VIGISPAHMAIGPPAIIGSVAVEASDDYPRSQSTARHVRSIS
jgi:hypothetical protein